MATRPYPTHLGKTVLILYISGISTWETLMLIAMLIPTHDLLLRLYIGELRGCNISTIFIMNVGKTKETSHLRMAKSHLS